MTDPEIPDAAAQAAATVMHAQDCGGKDCSHISRDIYLRDARLVLTAALPHLRVQKTRERLHLWVREEINRAIAYHSATKGGGHQSGQACDGWVALTEAAQLMHDDVDELLELDSLQPLPVVDREALMRLLHNKGAWCGTCDYEGGMDACEACRKCLGTYADAVLALLNGSANG